jgi:hypothetical protein
VLGLQKRKILEPASILGEGLMMYNCWETYCIDGVLVLNCRHIRIIGA